MTSPTHAQGEKATHECVSQEQLPWSQSATPADANSVATVR